MLKTIERSRLDNCKIKMVHFNHEGEAGCKIYILLTSTKRSVYTGIIY